MSEKLTVKQLKNEIKRMTLNSRTWKAVYMNGCNNAALNAYLDINFNMKIYLLTTKLLKMFKPGKTLNGRKC